MKNLSKDKKDALILTVMGTVFYCVFALQFFVTGQKKRIENYSKEVGKLEKKVSDLNRLTSKSDMINRDFNTAEAKLEKLEEYMISGDPFTWMISRMQEFKNSHPNVNFNFSRPSLDQTSIFPDLGFEVMRFPVNGRTTYHDLGSFIAELESKNPFFRVEKLSMSQKNGVPPVAGASTEVLDFYFELVAMLANQKDS